MQNKIISIAAAALACLAFNDANAQERFVRDTLKLDNGTEVRDQLKIKCGETKRLIGYVSLVSDQEAKELEDVFSVEKDREYLFEKFGNDLEKLSRSKNQDEYSSDTVFVCADSILLSKSYTYFPKSGISDRPIYIALYKDDNLHTFASVTSPKNRNERIANAVLDFVDALQSETDEISVNVEKKSRKKWSTNTILTCDLVLGYGYLNWAQNNPFSEPAGSDAHSLKWSNRWNIMLAFKLFPDNPIYLSTGIGYQSNVFNFENGLSLYPFTDGEIPTDIGRKKSKLVARYITVPLMLNFRLAKRIELHIGAIGGLNYRNSHTGFKASYTENGEKREMSTGSSFNRFATFKADAFAGIEFYGWTFYVSHSLTDMFDSSYPKELYPFSFGVMLGL